MRSPSNLVAGMIPLVLVVTACQGEPTQPSAGPVALANPTWSTALPDGRVPLFDQQIWDIVDENGETIWQNVEDQPFTGGYFRLASNLLSVDLANVRECVLRQSETFVFLDCDQWITVGSDDRTCVQDATYPIAQVSATQTCHSLFPNGTNFPEGIGPWAIFRVTAAPTAPGDRVFQRWEISIGGDPMPCTEGPGLTCTVSPTQVYGRGVMPVYRLVYGPDYAFGGFLAPVENAPAVNVAKAGRAIAVNFQLGGDQGLNILAEGSPSSQATTCDLAPGSEQIVTADAVNASGLSYDAESGTYTYVWKTEKSWSGTCRTFRMTLADDETYEAEFRFTR